MTTYNEEMAGAFATLGINGTTDEMAFKASGTMIGPLKGKNVLDVGIGAARSTEFLKELNPKSLVGVERDPDMLDEAYKNKIPGTDYILATGTQVRQDRDNYLPFKDNIFDVVFSSYVPCETATREDLVHLFSEMNRVLKLGGECYIITLNPEAFGCNFVSYHYDRPQEDHDKPLKSGDPIISCIHSDPPLRLPDTHWTIETLNGVFKECGFEIAACEKPIASPQDHRWLDETKVAPDVVYKLVKALTP